VTRRCETVLIVGAGLAGARCAETLRAEGFEGRVVLVGEEPLAPYERPALSKEYLSGRRQACELELRPQAFWEAHRIELRSRTQVVDVDPASRSALTRSGELMAWDHLVLATGARARALPAFAVPGVHVLRTAADADRLREAIQGRDRLVVVGAGFIGGEVASTVAASGVAVTVIDAGTAPLCRVFGDAVAGLLKARYAAAGIELVTGVSRARAVTGARGRTVGVALDGDAILAADVVVVGVGAVPASDLAAGWLGLAPDGGIPTDEHGRTAVTRVYACGDVASALDPSTGSHVRVEHWTSAVGGGGRVACAILGRPCRPQPVSFFWSDQLGWRLQYMARSRSWHRVECDVGPDSFEARYVDARGDLAAVLLANRPTLAGARRRELATITDRLAA
jgi:3-phenylpropionate/trans-cinnamate dioxygenase ferredoxin reductase subunit